MINITYQQYQIIQLYKLKCAVYNATHASHQRHKKERIMQTLITTSSQLMIELLAGYALTY